MHSVSCSFSFIHLMQKSAFRHVIVVQLLSHVRLFAIPCTAACQVSQSFTISHSLLKFMSIESVMLSNLLILSLLLFSPSIFSSIWAISNESAHHIRWPKYWSFSFSESVLSTNIQGWFPLVSNQVWLVWPPCSPRDSQESSPASQLESINSSAFSLLCGPTLTSVHHYWKSHSFDYMNLCWQSISLLFNTLSRLVITFLLRSKHLLISWLQSPSAVILEPKKRNLSLPLLFPPFICHEVMGPDAMILVFWMLHFKPAFSLSSFIFIKKLFISFSLSAIRVLSLAYLRLVFLSAILIPLGIHPAWHFVWCTALKLNKQ